MRMRRSPEKRKRDERKKRRKEERSEEEEANLDENDVEENKENSRKQEARTEEEETSRENYPLGVNLHRNVEGGREEGCTNRTLSEEIENILACTDEEETLLGRITEPEDIRDKDDMIVESWMKRLGSGYVVRFEDMFEEDVAAREDPPPQNGGNETEATNEAAGNTVKLNEVVEVINSFKEYIGGRLARIEEKVGEIDLRLAASEGFVQELLDARNADADVEEQEDISKRTSRRGQERRERTSRRGQRRSQRKTDQLLLVFVLKLCCFGCVLKLVLLR
ncbi:hypothetical protein F2Q69_00027451 [Brassica cretica]|uniref:DUF287 domain-containing protein n=1 Tax=Brassica cretica TaxID=69181 RepID=A0A8S9S0E2_BRACR|nr:hypothetical protein F2Q69_00027451 [Brassica cretica]